MLVLTAKEMRRAEELASQLGLTEENLMENAGEAIFKWLQSNYNLEGKKIYILAGKGNNGGDGYVLARLLSKAKLNINITVIMCDGIVQSSLAKKNCNKLVTENIEVINLVSYFDMIIEKLVELTENDIIIDAVYGTGFMGDLPPLIFSIFSIINKSKANRISIDIPSGIACDNGVIATNTFRANITLALGTYKPVHSIEACAIYCKRTEILDIGISKSTMEKACLGGVNDYGKIITVELIQSLLKPRDDRAHKGMYGKLLNIAGSRGFVGPAMISTLAAMRIGSGYTNLVTTKEVADVVAPHLMEAVTTPLPQNDLGTISAESCSMLDKLLAKSTACLIGCGLGSSPDCVKLVEYILKNADCHVIIDSDALNVLIENTDILKLAKKQVIITPHVGQMSKLVKLSLTDTINNFAKISLEFATKYNAIIAMKSDTTHIITPNEKIYRNETGNAGLAKTGSGDMLAGIIAGLITQGISPEEATICGVYINGATAEWLSDTHSTYSMLARDLIETIPAVMKDLSL